MNRFTTRLCLALVISYCLATSITAQDCPKGDKGKIEGVWVGTVIEGGKKDDQDWRVEFQGDKVTFTKKGKAVLTATYKITPDKSPARMDIKLNEKATIPAIYELKGDELKICHPFRQGDARPSALEATENTVLVTLKRQKS